MSRQFVAGKLKGEERKAIIQGVQKHMQEAALGAIKPLLTQFCEEELTVKLGRGKRAYKYRFFTPVRGHVPARGVFAFCDVPFPFAFSSSSTLKVWAVSEAR